MRKILLTTLLAGAMVLALQPFSGTQALAQEKKEAAKPPEPMKLKVGDMAPDFSLFAFDGQGLKKISLSDYRGKKQVALAFYVFAFTGG